MKESKLISLVPEINFKNCLFYKLGFHSISPRSRKIKSRKLREGEIPNSEKNWQKQTVQLRDVIVDQLVEQWPLSSVVSSSNPIMGIV